LSPSRKEAFGVSGFAPRNFRAQAPTLETRDLHHNRFVFQVASYVHHTRLLTSKDVTVARNKKKRCSVRGAAYFRVNQSHR
jgi:hypothetical protein